MPRFVVAVAPTFDVPVSITRPGDDPMEFTMIGRPLERQAFEAWYAEFPAAVSGPVSGLVAWIQQAYTGWGTGDLRNEHDLPLGFDADGLGRLLQVCPAAPADLRTCYARALLESRAGN